MIAYLKGTIAAIEDQACIADVNGIGYRVEVSSQTREALSAGVEIKLLIFHHITESDQRLFGFITQKEKNLFERLITVKGIGPKLGLTILSGMPAPALMEAIVTQDVNSLVTIPGIGKKSAERMVLELKDKLFDETAPSVVSGHAGRRDKREEAVSALEALGFHKRDVMKAVNSIHANESDATVSDLVKQALNILKR